MGYAIAAAVVSGKPVVTIEADSAFGFSGIGIETICRYQRPVGTPVCNYNGIYRGDADGALPSPTGFIPNARYDKLIEAFAGAGYHVIGTPSLTKALSHALDRDQGTVSRYTLAAVPLNNAVFSAADAPAAIRLNAFHSSV